MSINISLGEGYQRERAVNWIQLANNIVEEYKYGLSHGVQKDAIQNGWDAINGPKTKNYASQNWRFQFELITSNNKRLFIMTDSGTTGLTGNMTSADKYNEDTLPQDEKWARWESLAFKKSGKSDLGARGQGKMVFITASNEYKIYYDSLRNDGTYRFGGSKATDRSCPVFHFNGEEGKRKFTKATGLEPLKEKGTRVIIFDPKDDLIRTIESGEFLGYIEETWWPIILKYGAKISLKFNDIEKVAQVPSFFPITESVTETDTYKTWFVDRKKIKHDGTVYRIKHIRLAYNANEEKPERFQGVACFRGGMKVSTINFPIIKYRPYVYGYVEFEENVDEELRKIETPNHYDFQYRGIWRVLRLAIEEESEAFGNKKLGMGINPKAKEYYRRNEAETNALAMLRLLTKGWMFSNRTKGINNPVVEPGETKVKEIGLKLHKFDFPNESNTPRLNYGEKISGFECESYNNSPEQIKTNFRLITLSGERVVETLTTSNNILKADEKISYGPFELKIDQKKYPDKGEYKLKLILSNSTTKERIDELTRKFWVEADPPLSAPFDVQGFDFSNIPGIENAEKLEWILENEGDNRYKLFYNIGHNMYRAYDTDAKYLSIYLSEIFFQGALELMIKRAEGLDSQSKTETKVGPFSLKTLRSSSPLSLFQEISKINSQARFFIYKK